MGIIKCETDAHRKTVNKTIRTSSGVGGTDLTHS